MHDVPRSVPDHWNIGRRCKNGVKVIDNFRNAIFNCCLVARHTALGRECTHLFYRVSILQCSAHCRTAVSRRQTQALTCSPTHPGKTGHPERPSSKAALVMRFPLSPACIAAPPMVPSRPHRPGR